jgi:hypothetical protein
MANSQDYKWYHNGLENISGFENNHKAVPWAHQMMEYD